MKLVTQFEAATLSTGKLRGLLTRVYTALATAQQDSPEQFNALFTIHNIKNELASRLPTP